MGTDNPAPAMREYIDAYHRVRQAARDYYHHGGSKADLDAALAVRRAARDRLTMAQRTQVKYHLLQK